MVSDSKQFNPETDIASLSGKVFFITGGTAGIGKSSILQLSKHQPAHIYFSGRDSRKAQAVIEEVKSQVPDAPITFIECDLASLQSVKKAADEFVSLSTRLDVLMCNAGVMALPPGLTKDGYEIQFGTNHLGHALLIKSLLPTLIRTAEQPNSDVRVVILSSQAYLTHPTGGIIFKDLHTPQDMAIFGAMTRYSQSKLANLLYAAELARRYPNITSVSIHPGIVKTELMHGASSAMQKLSAVWRMVSPEQGAHNQVWASTCEKSKLVNGAYYEPVGKLTEKCREGKSSQLAERLWDWTEAELKIHLDETIGVYKTVVLKIRGKHSKQNSTHIISTLSPSQLLPTDFCDLSGGLTSATLCLKKGRKPETGDSSGSEQVGKREIGGGERVEKVIQDRTLFTITYAPNTTPMEDYQVRIPICFPPTAQGFLYYHQPGPHAPLAASRLKFRVCDSLRSFHDGQDLRRPSGSIWGVSMWTMLRMGVADALVEQGMIDGRRLDKFRALAIAMHDYLVPQPTTISICYTLGQPFRLTVRHTGSYEARICVAGEDSLAFLRLTSVERLSTAMRRYAPVRGTGHRGDNVEMMVCLDHKPTDTLRPLFLRLAEELPRPYEGFIRKGMVLPYVAIPPRSKRGRIHTIEDALTILLKQHQDGV
ncbi:short-chain alcohol dehydrogenase [Paramarasmius palmivorus]|uniref:Short-chain alcohol dehydrogenase n=1 Tax=Paramarasmius palmivorus TaxID=297713 RepID=A0AAW0D2V7_9AGAR